MTNTHAPRRGRRLALLSFTLFAALAAFGALGAACGEADAQFNVKYAPDFSRAGTTISVFGVFKDGRMSQEAWDELGVRVSSAFAQQACPAEYDVAFVGANQDLASAVDDYARANGTTDELVDQFAPAAKGDMILVLTVAGHPPLKGADAGASAPSYTPSQSSMSGGGMRRTRGSLGSMPARPRIDYYEVAASLFSVRDHKSVARVAMEYSGASEDEALKAFTAKLRASLPGATCVGWKGDAKVDPEKVRKMME